MKWMEHVPGFEGNDQKYIHNFDWEAWGERIDGDT
jgi:hypothetical protein